jgi:spore coat protein U-like protein
MQRNQAVNTTNLIQLPTALALLGAIGPAWAALNCNNPVPTSTGFSTAYTGPTGAVPNITQGTITFSCRRTLAGDPTNLLLRGNNGTNAVAPPQNRAEIGATGNFLNYEGYRDSACATVWTNNSDATSIPFTLVGALNVWEPVNLNFWGCVPLGQPLPAAGTYTDTVTMQVRRAGAGTVYGTGTFTVSIVAPATCTLSTAPGNVNFTYTSFSLAPATASTTFGATCTNRLPYQMSLDAYNGTLLGLNYTLDINAAAPPVASRGTGVAQTHTINGAIAAGQAGTCATATCTGFQTRTLTITY